MSMQDNLRNQARQNNRQIRPTRPTRPTSPNGSQSLSEQKSKSDKKTFDWTIVHIPEKDKNKKQWPFKYVRDNGKPTKVECRSITDFKRSFEGTPYNFTDCKKLDSRYSAVIKILLKEYKEKISDIVYMFISYDSVYFMVNGDSNVYGFTYSNKLIDDRDPERLLNGFLIKNNILENKIKYVFKNYQNIYEMCNGNRQHNPMLMQVSEQLECVVVEYKDRCKKMCTIDSKKKLVDIFDNSNFTFSSLKYLVFVGDTSVSIDHQGIIYEKLLNYMGTQNLASDIRNALYEYPSLEDELNGYNSFIDKLKKDKSSLKALKYVYNLTDIKNPSNKEEAHKIFLELKKDEYDKDSVYSKSIDYADNNIVAKDIEQITKKRDELDKKLGIDNIEDCKTKFLIHFNLINNLISKINVITTVGNQCYQVANDVEKDIWAKYLYVATEDESEDINKLKHAIQAEYDYKRFSSGNPKETVVYNFNVMNQLGKVISNEKDGYYAPEGLLSFYNLLPTYFKDARKTKDSMGVGFDTAEKAEKSLEVIKELENQILDFFEVFIGCQYGVLTTYMKRFMNIFGKEQAADFAIQLMPSIKNDGVKLKCSRNVLSIAERFLYRDLGYSLKKTDENYYGTEKSKSELGKYESFCKVAIDKINGYTTELLTHSDLSSTEEIKKAKVENLFAQYECVKFIFEQYKVFFKIQNVM